ncbi:putative protein serine/threonine kinase [Tieghemostelium lacteum]|uniref:Protein kinase domain-containing protein n=1 Tax=Tieghemostelium lacteum TaxID=361077 RepID=A0A152A6K1_TIELA|nr:putative protein serine/threonine kinase [Tieghemostelium lacteum]|eukprot:KYR01840.1 putative protein serine/threonine kinase [Tieghemostelium lacteum]
MNIGFTTGSLIKGRWTVLKKIGQGAFGEIYSGKNIINGEQIAIKVEKVDTKKQVLRLEVAVLKKLQACPYVCRFITCGRHNDYNYMVMELLGDNLSELRRRQADGKFTMGTTLKLGIQMIQSLQAVHDLGYLHRDVKPSNFAIGLGQNKRNITYLIDFGLARRYVLASGEVRPPRDSTGFRGTARYASINSHLSKDLGRRDDLWSIFYVLIEFAEGQLPWRKLKDKDQIGDMKMKYNTPELVRDLPPQFSQFMKHLKSLNYEDRPNYVFLQSLLNECYVSLGLNESTPFDWEVATQAQSSTQNLSIINTSMSSLGVPKGSGMPSPGLDNDQQNSNNSNNVIVNNQQQQQGKQPYSTKPNNLYHSSDQAMGNDDSPQPQLQRRDSASASVIAASSEDNKESNGSWNQKTSPRRDTKGDLDDHSGGGGGNTSKHLKAKSSSHQLGSQNANNNNTPHDTKIDISNQHVKPSAKCCSSKCIVM